ncbi:GIY-YIG nuclease family protein [Gemmatimonadota bacterium]
MDRKELIRKYKETPRPMGVYCLRNTTNGKTLIGTSLDLNAGLNRHRAQLQMGGHPNRELQNDWKEMGQEAFTFEVLDTLTPSELPDCDPKDDLRLLEAMWLKKLAQTGDSTY